MDEISNKTLATLLVVAIVISLAGTFFAMRGVSQVTNIISGGAVATAAGTASVYINESVSITLLDTANVDFGSGYRNASVVDNGAECNLSSHDPKPDCWAETDYQSSWTNPGDFTVENNGNVFANVSVKSNVSGENYFNSSCVGKTIIDGDHDFEWQGRGLSSLGCIADGTLDNATNHSFTTSDVQVCSNLSPSDGSDDFNVTVVLRVPSGPSGSCASLVTFTAARST